MKRLLLLSVMFCIGVLQGFAQDYFTYTDENGVNWECFLILGGGNTMSDGTYEDYSEVYIEGASNYGEEVTIPETVKYDGKSYVITKLRDVFRDSKIIKKVTLPKSVTWLLDNTFNNCTLLSEIVNTEQIKICGQGTFSGCSSLKNIDLSSCEEIDYNAFANCNNLQSVNLKKCKTIQMNAFSGCSNLQSVGDLSSCTTIGDGGFLFCSSLKSIDISNCNSLAGSVFQGCSKLEEVKLSEQINKINGNTFMDAQTLKVSI